MLDPHAGVNRYAAARRGEHGIQIKLRYGGDVQAEPRQSVHEVRQCGAVGGRRAAKSPHKTSCLPFEYELFGIDVGQRSNPEGSFADELGEDTSGAERDERAEHGILDKAREELRPSRDHRLHEDGTADPLYSGANLSFVLQIESYAPVSVLCAPAAAVFTTSG